MLLRPAFWSALLPTTVPGRVSDIWRSYVAQPILWASGYRLGFTAPTVRLAILLGPAHPLDGAFWRSYSAQPTLWTVRLAIQLDGAPAKNVAPQRADMTTSGGSEPH